MKNKKMVLVINAGSTSIKYQIINMLDNSVVAKGLCERIGLDGKITHVFDGVKTKYIDKLANHDDAISRVVSILISNQSDGKFDLSDIIAVGHRTVTGDETLNKPIVLSDSVIDHLYSISGRAPLHVPPALKVVEACKKQFISIPQVAVFDTAFHNTMPKKACIYAIPYKYYEKHGIRRYGYHGISHQYVSHRLAEIKKTDIKNLKIITCHLGGGSSVTAIDGGISVDTSMGYTPLEGLLMGTRSGTIDPAIIFTLAKLENMSLEKLESMLNNQSGYLGLSGISSDDRDLEQAAKRGDERAMLAVSILRYQIKKYIGSYAAVMNGVDAIVFTGGMGEHSYHLRDEVCRDMTYLGVELDTLKNQSLNGEEACISKSGSGTEVWIIPTNEELLIAKDTYNVYQNLTV